MKLESKIGALERGKRSRSLGFFSTCLLIFVLFVPVLVNAVSWDYKKFYQHDLGCIELVVSNLCILPQNDSWNGLSI